MIKQSVQTMLASQRQAFVRQALFGMATGVPNNGQKFHLNYKPTNVDHKLWKNAIEVSPILNDVLGDS